MDPGRLSWPGLCLVCCLFGCGLSISVGRPLLEVIGLGSREVWVPMTFTSSVTKLVHLCILCLIIGKASLEYRLPGPHEDEVRGRT